MYEIFVQLLQKHNVTPYQVSKSTGIAQSTFSDWKKKKGTLHADKLQKIAVYFGVSMDYLMGWEGLPQLETFNTFLSKHEKDLIDAYRSSPDMQMAVDRILNIVSPNKVYVNENHPIKKQMDDEFAELKLSSEKKI